MSSDVAENGIFSDDTHGSSVVQQLFDGSGMLLLTR